MTTTIAVEVAHTPAELARGLMYRKSLERDQGMLFIFNETSEHWFWMKNTLIPLDMIFIDEEGHVAGIVADAVPMTTSHRSINAPSRYVLEVNAGFCATHRIARGDRVRLEGVTSPSPGTPTHL